MNFSNLARWLVAAGCLTLSSPTEAFDTTPPAPQKVCVKVAIKTMSWNLMAIIGICDTPKSMGELAKLSSCTPPEEAIYFMRLNGGLTPQDIQYIWEKIRDNVKKCMGEEPIGHPL